MQESAQSRRAVKFGVFEADFTARELRKNGAKIRLQDQPFQVLALLLENPGQVITREELRQKLWSADTFVDFDNGLNTCINKIREALGDTAEKPRFVETLPRRGYRFIGGQPTVAGAAKRIESLVVLPLENLSRDPEQEYFAEGMTEALITTLAKIGALRIISRTSAMRYKKTDKRLPQIAQELNVDGVVEGTVLRSGDRVRISAQLIDARTDTHLWAESYDRDIRDVLVLQAEVAQAVAREIQAKLTPLEKVQFAQVSAVDPEAYEAYLKGRYHSSDRSQDGIVKAVGNFQDAIAKDPCFAAAYAGWADCLSLLCVFGYIAPEQFDKAKSLAMRALELDPNLAEAHASIAWVKMWHEFDFPGARKEYERCLELNPRYATARSWFGCCLGMMGRHEEGYKECQRAIQLDPLSAPIWCLSGTVYWQAGRFDQAVQRCQKAIELDPAFAWAHALVAVGYLAKSDYSPAINAAKRAVELSPRSMMYLAFLAETHAAAGNRDEARQILKRLDELSKQQYVTPYHLARAYTALGERDKALTLLEVAYRERQPWMMFLKADSLLDTLRPDPRFQNLLRRMNFPP